MALSLLAGEWAATRGHKLQALTVDHGLRPEAAREAAQVGEWMRALQIPHHILAWRPPARLRNLQAAAREARYGLMREWCAAHGFSYLLTGHHRDDQAETLLLRLKRGSHVRGLSGMKAATPLGGMTLLRPLLEVPKAQLMALLEARGQAWIEDPSNASDDYERNRLRTKLAALPGEEDIRRQLAASAARLSQLQAETAGRAEAFLAAQPPGQCDFGGLDGLPPDVRVEALHRLLAAVSARPHPPRFNDLERLWAALSQRDTRRTLHGCLIERRGGTLIFRAEGRR